MPKIMSLFDGSGGFPLAASLCGITPTYASEVEPYPIAVTRSRFPNMVHLGSVTDVKGGEVEPVDVITFGSPCFPAGTLVLTKDGYIPIEEIRVGDEVFTHKGNWKPVSAIGNKNSKTVRMKGNHYGIIATPNHPFYSAEQGRVWNGNGYDRTLENVGEWTSADQMEGKRWAVPNRFSGLEIPEIEVQSKKQNNAPAINADFMYIIGRWLGDGWLRDGQRPHRPNGQTWGQIFICSNRTEADGLEQILQRVFDGNSAVSRFSERTVEKFHVSNQALCKWLKWGFGEKADGKTLPAWVLCMPEDFRIALLNGYLDSDGYKHKENSWKATTVSKRLAHSIRLLGETLGYSCTVHYADVGASTEIEGRKVNQKPQYQIVLSNEKRKTSICHGPHNWYKCRTVENFSDNQTVYNITVDDDHSYIVEGFVVHNCQDLSVAGKRAGLKHEGKGDDETTRSGLFMEAVRIIKEMRGATNGLYPAFAVWENVPGAFSSNKGEDFRTVLEELIRIVEPTAVMPSVPKAGWAYADVYCGTGWSLAYRVLDAQFWGVPQRRRRIYLVLDLRGERAGEVLFKCEGLRGHFAESGTPWETTAGNAEDCAGAADSEIKCITLEPGIAAREGGHIYEGVSGTLRANMGDNQMTIAFAQNQRDEVRDLKDVAGALAAEPGMKQQTFVCYSVENHPADSRVNIDASGKCQTLTSRTGTGGGNVPMVMEAKKVWCLQGNGIDRADTAGCNGKGWKEDVCYTLNTIDRPAVSYAECYQKSTGPLMANSHPGSYTGQDAYSDMLVVGKECTGVDCRNFTEHSELYPTLQAKPNGGQSLNYSGAVRTRYIVRRLTPTECARLQGFPDKWGHPDRKDDFTDDEYAFWLNVRNTHATINGKATREYTKDQMLRWYNGLHTDSAEYKLWGNGIALPCALYVMEGIAKCLSTEK